MKSGASVKAKLEELATERADLVSEGIERTTQVLAQTASDATTAARHWVEDAVQVPQRRSQRVGRSGFVLFAVGAAIVAAVLAVRLLRTRREPEVEFTSSQETREDDRLSSVADQLSDSAAS